MHSVFTRKQSKTNTNKKPTSPYTAPAIPCHLLSTSLAKSLSGALELPMQDSGVGRGWSWKPNSQCGPKKLSAAQEASIWPFQGAEGRQSPSSCLCISKRLRMECTRDSHAYSEGLKTSGSGFCLTLTEVLILLKAKVKNGKDR